MKRILLIILVMLLTMQMIPAMAENYDDDRNYSNFVGRLYINDVDIDVALYRSNEQYVVDRKDSAAYFEISSSHGSMLVADHCTQGFATLQYVEVGMTAKIVKADGSIVYYTCVDIFKGHNTGHGIVDWYGNNVADKSDLLMYTCFAGSYNVWVVLWNETGCVTE